MKTCSVMGPPYPCLQDTQLSTPSDMSEAARGPAQDPQTCYGGQCMAECWECQPEFSSARYLPWHPTGSLYRQTVCCLDVDL
jgi:hypothetical protein